MTRAESGNTSAHMEFVGQACSSLERGMRIMYPTTAETQGTRLGGDGDGEGLRPWVAAAPDGFRGCVALCTGFAQPGEAASVSSALLMSLGHGLRCAASGPILAHVCRFAFGCNLDETLATLLCLLWALFGSLNEQSVVAGKAQLRWHGQYSQLFGSFRWRQVIWGSDCTWVDWLSPLVP